MSIYERIVPIIRSVIGNSRFLTIGFSRLIFKITTLVEKKLQILISLNEVISKFTYPVIRKLIIFYKSDLCNIIINHKEKYDTVHVVIVGKYTHYSSSS